METQILACTSDWLDGMNTIIDSNYCAQPIYNYYPSYYPYYYPVYYPSPTRPIKLTLSEIEKLRKAAKDDESIKSILVKFTNLIEIEVNF